MAKLILSVGVEVPGGEIEEVSVREKRSLLDADIIIFSPSLPYSHSESSYQGRPCLSDYDSFTVREALTHWRRELSAAFKAGRFIFVLLRTPEIVFAATGEHRYSGTGRNARSTRMVSEVSSYSALPLDWKFHEVSGREMSVVPQVHFFSPYWNEFGSQSYYETYFEGSDIKQPLVKTKAANRILGAALKKGAGALLVVPNIDFDQEGFIDSETINGKEQEVWSEKSRIFSRKLCSVLVNMSQVIASEVIATPPPEWVRSSTYQLDEEGRIFASITQVSSQINKLEEESRSLHEQHTKAGILRDLLFEQGKRLENVVLHSLHLLGFEASNLRENDSEFDAVITSAEGRFIGEIEGKDNKAINIDKITQLERNINEDFARDSVDEHAKGVLFGNAFRLTLIGERDAPFTDKCKLASKRLGFALVHTPDLFIPCRYLQDHPDPEYARRCREAIFNTSGELVIFPSPPLPGTENETVDVEAPVEQQISPTKYSE